MCKSFGQATGLGPDTDRLSILDSLDRREFMGFCLKVAAVLGLSASYAPKIAEAIEAGARKPSVIWLHLAECTGDSEAFIRSTYPSTEELILNILSVDYHETIMAASGHQAESALEQAMKENKGKYIAVCEGAIPTATPPGPGGKPGAFLTIGGRTGIDIAREVCENAFAVMCVGTCSCFGGVQAQRPNPTGAMGVEDAIGVPTLKIPGCPHNVVNSVATIVNFLLLGSLPKTDKLGRPLFAFGKRIHDHCPRRAHFDAGQFVEKFGDEGAKNNWCLYKVGCKGPQTYHNCSLVEYNDGTSWPIKAGHGCIGCSEPQFWDNMQPFYERLPNITLPGVEAGADKVGFALVGAAAAGVAAHAVWSFANRKKFDPTLATKDEDKAPAKATSKTAEDDDITE
ncbi:MAG: hydrogenase small subunit [Nitrospinota bacterium]|nr:hydrogenase small subunit [Nitrospinota bacterium]MDH5756854.1 hydrogenase small subunit [Nitrospinota bacterium]